MAEEGTLGLPPASERDDAGEPSKEELQRRMEEARETITQTVTEIKETVTNQYYSMKETVSEALDWRHHFRNNPIAFSVGALSVGFLVGYGLASTFKGEGGEGYPSSDETDVYARTNAAPSKYEDDENARQSAFHGHSYASQPIMDQVGEAAGQQSRGYEAEAEDENSYGRSSASSSGGSVTYLPPREAREQTQEKTGLFERFKGTTAYDRLQSEVSTLGDRFIDELSTTAHTVVLPALFNKIKELFGVDLGGNQGQEQSSQGTSQAGGAQGNTGAARAASASASSTPASLASASRGSSDASSYATSENRGYGAQGTGRENDKGGEGSSVLDLDR